LLDRTFIGRLVKKVKQKLKNNRAVCVITYPRPLASVKPLSNLISVLLELSGFVFLVTGNEGDRVLDAFPNLRGHSFKYKSKRFFLAKIVNHIILQIKISIVILRINSKVDEYIFFMGEGLILPMIIGKLVKKPIILILAGSTPKIYERENNFLSTLFIYMETMNYHLASKIVLYSPRLIEEWQLEKYRHKVLIAHEHYLDFNEFKITKEFHKRDILVSYVGRLSEEKGVMNFIKSIPAILKARNDVKFIVGGDGSQKSEIEKFVRYNNLQDQVRLTGWISYIDLPHFLNEIHLVILPSFTEGLPNIVLEAMACGTLVMATAVGAIPDFIHDGETGFLLKNNSSDCIAKTVIRTLNYPNLSQVVHNARFFVEKEFTFEKTKDNYAKILDEVMP
jgi:glycosyltransferase involved in cell wall biosynthesis